MFVRFLYVFHKNMFFKKAPAAEMLLVLYNCNRNHGTSSKICLFSIVRPPGRELVSLFYKNHGKSSKMCLKNEMVAVGKIFDATPGMGIGGDINIF